MIRHQLRRRNQTPEQISYYRGMLYEQRKKIHGGDRKSSGHFVHLIPTVKTANVVAQEYNVTEKTIRSLCPPYPITFDGCSPAAIRSN